MRGNPSYLHAAVITSLTPPFLGPIAGEADVRVHLSNPRVAVLAVALAALGTVGMEGNKPAVRQLSSACHDNDIVLTGYVLELKGTVSGTDSFHIDERTHLNLPQLPADSVTAVTDSTTCQRAALAYGRNLSVPDTTTARQVYAIRVGATRYVVADPGVTKGEFIINMVFDSSFTTMLSTFAH
jgi:hypothetical protein